MRAYLAEFGHLANFFGSVVESGAHSASLEMVLSGRVDGAAIDSTVLEWFMAMRQDLVAGIRVVDTIGPSPIPPWVISRRVPETLRSAIRALLLNLHTDPFGKAMLERAGLKRFVVAEDDDYNSIRAMAGKAAQVTLA